MVYFVPQLEQQGLETKIIARSLLMTYRNTPLGPPAKGEKKLLERSPPISAFIVLNNTARGFRASILLIVSAITRSSARSVLFTRITSASETWSSKKLPYMPDSKSSTNSTASMMPTTVTALMPRFRVLRVPPRARPRRSARSRDARARIANDPLDRRDEIELERAAHAAARQFHGFDATSGKDFSVDPRSAKIVHQDHGLL